MKIKDMSKEEIELMSYSDLAYRILKEAKKALNTPIIFRHICELLGYNDAEYADKIGNFYTSLTIDKRFVLLDSAEWDLRDNHSIDTIIDDDIELEEDLTEDEELEEVIEPDEVATLDAILEDDDLEDEDDDLEDLTIVSEEEIE